MSLSVAPAPRPVANSTVDTDLQDAPGDGLVRKLLEASLINQDDWSG